MQSLGTPSSSARPSLQSTIKGVTQSNPNPNSSVSSSLAPPVPISSNNGVPSAVRTPFGQSNSLEKSNYGSANTPADAFRYTVSTVINNANGNSGSKFQRLVARRMGRGKSIEEGPGSTTTTETSLTKNNDEVIRNNYQTVSVDSPPPSSLPSTSSMTGRHTYPVNYLSVDDHEHGLGTVPSSSSASVLLPVHPSNRSHPLVPLSRNSNLPAPTSPLPSSAALPTNIPKKQSISVDGDDEDDGATVLPLSPPFTSSAVPSSASLLSTSLQNIASIGTAISHLPPPPPPPPLPKNKSTKTLQSTIKKGSTKKLVATPGSTITDGSIAISTNDAIPPSLQPSTPLSSNNTGRLSGTSTTLAKTILFQNAIAVAAGTQGAIDLPIDLPIVSTTVSLSSDPTKADQHSVASSPSSFTSVSPSSKAAVTVPNTNDTVNNIMRSTSFSRSRSNRFPNTTGSSSATNTSSASPVHTHTSPTNTDLASELDILPHEDIKGYIPGNVQFRNEFRKTTVLPTDTISAPTFAPGSPLDLALTATIKKRKRRVHKPDTIKRLQQGTEEFLRRKAAKVLGKIIDKEHRQYHLSFGMMLGIYTSCSYGARMPLSSGTETVSSNNNTNGTTTTSSTNDTDVPAPVLSFTDMRLELDDFMKVRKLVFPPQGSPLTPPHRLPGTFKFKDYAPAVFYQLRERFNIDQQQYLKSLGGAYEYIEFSSNSKSGSFFFYSHDGKFMIKTQSKSESKFLRRILAHYYQYVMMYPGTYITRFYGMHRIKMPHIRKKIHFVVMQSVFYGDDDIHEMYDLKGSTVGRSATEKEKARGLSKCVLKDNDLITNHTKIRLGEERRKMFLAQLALDASFLERMKIMDYSLLLGIHHKKLRNKVEAHALTQSPEHGPFEPPIAEVDEDAIVSQDERDSGGDVSASYSDNDNTANGSTVLVDKFTGVRITHTLPSHQLRNQSIARTTMSNAGSSFDPVNSTGDSGTVRVNGETRVIHSSSTILDNINPNNSGAFYRTTDQSNFQGARYASDDDSSATESAAEDSDQDERTVTSSTTTTTTGIHNGRTVSSSVSRPKLQKQESMLSVDSAAAAAASAASLAASARLAKVLQQQHVNGTGVTSVMETLTKIRDNHARREQHDDSVPYGTNVSGHSDSRPTYDDSLTALGSMIWSVDPNLQRFVNDAYRNGKNSLSPPGPSDAGGGIIGKDNDGNDTDEIYYMGIIDILQQYDLRKMGETAFKSLLHPVSGISAVSPAFYAKRFVEFLEKYSE